MRIFYAADTTPNAALESNLWRENLCAPLIDMGHEIVEFRYDLRDIFRNLDPADPDQRHFIERTRPRTSRELVTQVRAAHAERPIDLFLSYFYDACVLPEAIDEIRSLGIVTMNWYCNASYQLHLVSAIAPRYDWCLVPEKYRLADYAALGARPIYCQMAANPSVYRPHAVPLEFDVTFVGQAYGERPAYVRYLHDEGIDIRVWGPGWTGEPLVGKDGMGVSSLRRVPAAARKLLTARTWKRALGRLRRRAAEWGGLVGQPTQSPVLVPREIAGNALTDLEMVLMYSRSRINLGFSSVGETHSQNERIVQIRLRDFEVPMSGGFYMVEHMDELREFYEIGREIVCYHDRRDLADKIRFYLTHEREREEIRLAGRERALRDHTWRRRFENVFAEAGLVT